MAEAGVELGGRVSVLRSGFCYGRTPDGECFSLGLPIPVGTVQQTMVDGLRAVRLVFPEEVHRD
jgi:hypothetical protein